MIDKPEILDALVRDWIESCRSGDSCKDVSPCAESPRESEVRDWVLHLPYESPELAWRFILVALANSDDERILAEIAAGPLESLLGENGEEFIERIVSCAKANQKFRRTLSFLWRHGMSQEVWEKITEVAEYKAD